MSQSQASVGGPERVESGRGLRLPSATRLAGVAAIFAAIQVMYHTVSGVPLDAEFVILAALGGGLSACVVGHLVVNLGVGRRTGFGIIWLALFVVQLFAGLIEGAFFTTAISSASVFLGGTIVSLLITAAEAGAAIALFPLPPASRRLRDLLRDYRWGVGSRAWRLTVGGLAYFPIYFLFGGLVSPYAIPYYTDPSDGLGLVIPSFSVMIPVELLRGFMFVACIVPILAAWRLNRWSAFLFSAAFLHLGRLRPLRRRDDFTLVPEGSA